MENVRFDYSRAAELAEELRATARVVEYEVGERSRVGSLATYEWRGVYAEQFGQRLGKCLNEGQALATKLRATAERLDEAAERARAERERIRSLLEKDVGAVWPG